MVAAMPRFIRQGLRTWPSSRSILKFCMLRAPIWKQSMYGSITSICEISMTSVMTSKPFSSAASRISFRPSMPIPWKL